MAGRTVSSKPQKAKLYFDEIKILKTGVTPRSSLFDIVYSIEGRQIMSIQVDVNFDVGDTLTIPVKSSVDITLSDT